MKFSDIVGNEKTKELLVQILEQQKLSHSYLFLGKQGIGKFIIAKQWSKMILCQNKQTGCDNCKSCIEFDSNSHPDFFIIDNEGATIKIDQIRQMQVKILEKPIVSDKKVYIINDAENMTKEAQNCLLKTLEEPPEYAIIILIGSNENSFLNTIRSRCTKINLKRLNENELRKVLQDKFDIKLEESLLKAARRECKCSIIYCRKTRFI